MRIRKPIRVSNIRIDRAPVNLSTYQLARFLEAGGTVPAIKVRPLPSGEFVIRDGRHRVTAYKLLGWPEIEATYGL